MSTNPEPYTILVADDERDVVDVTADMLETFGCRVLRAYSAREALAHLDDDPAIALVVSDIRMPEVDGFDLMRVIRYRFGKLAVVLMTGLPVTEEDHVPPGASILRKPFTFDELRSVLPPGALAGAR
jgi:CheY-like chemotaxis protein